MKVNITAQSKHMAETIAQKVKSFHQYHFLLFDLAREFEGEITYLEIGCYAGASACLMVQRPQTNIISIDTGLHVPKESVLKSVAHYNIHNNLFLYVKGDSHNTKIVNEVESVVKPNGVHILFIDGGHKFADVVQDFYNYSPMVCNGGFIVFDDYHDYRYSPEVKTAVDWLVDNQKFDGFEILEIEKNEFIIQKK